MPRAPRVPALKSFPEWADLERALSTARARVERSEKRLAELPRDTKLFEAAENELNAARVDVHDIERQQRALRPGLSLQAYRAVAREHRELVTRLAEAVNCGRAIHERLVDLLRTFCEAGYDAAAFANGRPGLCEWYRRAGGAVEYLQELAAAGYVSPRALLRGRIVPTVDMEFLDDDTEARAGEWSE